MKSVECEEGNRIGTTLRALPSTAREVLTGCQLTAAFLTCRQHLYSALVSRRIKFIPRNPWLLMLANFLFSLLLHSDQTLRLHYPDYFRLFRNWPLNKINV